MKFTRRGLFGLLPGAAAAVVVKPVPAEVVEPTNITSNVSQIERFHWQFSEPTRAMLHASRRSRWAMMDSWKYRGFGR